MGFTPRLSLAGALPGQRAANDVDPAACDGRIARALAAVAARPDERWTVAKLAKVAGLSRAAFARRFAAEVGAPPLRHVAALRMHRAAELLARTDASLADTGSSAHRPPPTAAWCAPSPPPRDRSALPHSGRAGGSPARRWSGRGRVAGLVSHR
jgi:AraC-like DNA-binding protein